MDDSEAHFLIGAADKGDYRLLMVYEVDLKGKLQFQRLLHNDTNAGDLIDTGADLGAWGRLHEMTTITNNNQSHTSYRKYKSENGCTRTSEYISGGIRCHGGVSIHC
jgi:hypothetical protein